MIGWDDPDDGDDIGGAVRPKPTSGRPPGERTGIAILLLLPIPLLVGGVIDLGAFVTSQTDGGHLDDVGLLWWCVLGAAIAIAPPLAVFVIQLAICRADPGHSEVAWVGAMVVLLVAVVLNLAIIGLQAVGMVETAQRRAQPPTTAETHFAGKDAREALGRIGDRTVQLLGGDPRSASVADGSADRVTTTMCSLDNSDWGTQYAYSFPRDLVPGSSSSSSSPTPVPTAEPTPGALQDLRRYWAEQGITTSTVAERPRQLDANAAWLSGYSFARVGPEVVLVTGCMAN